MFKVKFVFNEEQLEISLNSRYKYFINTICNILKISNDKFNNLIVSYIDSDEDNIILSGPEDYDIFFQQIAQKQVDNFKVTIKENCDLDQDQCLMKFLEYKDKQELENNNNNIKNNDENKINEDENINNNHKEDNNNNINNININNKYIEKYDIKEFNNDFEQNQKDNEDVPIDNLIFDYKCSNCELNPILCKLFYCDKCQFYLCEECQKKGVAHEHNLLVIESKEELRKIKDKENDELYKNRLEIEKINEQEQNQRNYNNNNFINYNYQNNFHNNIPNNINNNPYNCQYNHHPINEPINIQNYYQFDRTIHYGQGLQYKKRGDRFFYMINSKNQNMNLNHNNFPINPNHNHHNQNNQDYKNYQNYYNYYY